MTSVVIATYTCPLCRSAHGSEDEAERCRVRCEGSRTEQAASERGTLPAQIVREELQRALVPVIQEFRTLLERAAELEVIGRKKYLTEAEVERLFGIPASTLRTKRSRGGGPAYVKDGGRVSYARKAVLRYLEEREIRGHVRY